MRETLTNALEAGGMILVLFLAVFALFAGGFLGYSFAAYVARELFDIEFCTNVCVTVVK